MKDTSFFRWFFIGSLSMVAAYGASSKTALRLRKSFVAGPIAWVGQESIAPPDSTPPDTSRKPYRAGVRPNTTPKDRNGSVFVEPESSSPLLLPNPGIETKVELDSATGQYIVYERNGQTNYRPVSSMTLEQYQKYLESKNQKDYMQAKGDPEAASPVGGRSLIPKIYISPMFDRIFGGNYVDLRPTGNVMLDLGGQWQRIENPALPIRQQRNGNFRFDQQINVNLTGSVGEKLKININQDTKASFDFENLTRLGYTGYDNEIIQKIEGGNVSLPISSSLITGAQNLFGLKTHLRFGKLNVVSVASSQRGKTEKIQLKGGAQTRDVNIRADQYDANRHFFLAQFFRDRYDTVFQLSLSPTMIASGITITRVEAYITNRANNTQTLRNMMGFMDLGEGDPRRIFRNTNSAIVPPGGGMLLAPASNTANRLFDALTTRPTIRESNSQPETELSALGLVKGTDYEIIRGARRLSDRDFTFHPQLGYMSLNTAIRDDEVLAVSYEYTFNGRSYKVGELTEDYSELKEDKFIFLKLLRPSTIQTNLPTWDLMMKNIYLLNASQVGRENFQLRIIYRDDSSGVDNPSLHSGQRIKDVPLVQVFNLDRFNPLNELGPDGNFDYLEGITIDSRNGRVIFPVKEPFGANLRRQFLPSEGALVDKYVFDDLYRLTPADALQAANKAKFFLVGKIQSSASNEISLPAFNLQPGAVSVFAGITPLIEGTHYTVDYDLGRVRITDQSILNSGQEIEIRFEKQELFQFQQRSFFGTRLDYAQSKDINIGGTLLYLNERPLIRRVSIGDEPTRNVLWGLDLNYKKESRWITRAVDFLPFIQTKVPSMITFSGEYARLHPGTSNFIDPKGEGISFVDDFEGSRTAYDITRIPQRWKLGSTPQVFPDAAFSTTLAFNHHRARLSWYTIDNIFYRSGGTNRPKNITKEDLENNYVRAVGPFEVFPQRSAQAVNLNETTFDLAFYPSERGPYNFNPNLTSEGRLISPRESWGAITRPITSDTDFDNANIEYIDFWMMDPFLEGPKGTIEGNTTAEGRNGRLTFDLGTISEDVMKDGRHAFEQGLPTPNQTPATDSTQWGRVPRQQILTRAFDNNPGSRISQDLGLDGLDNQDERRYYSQSYLSQLPPNLSQQARASIENDMAGDDFQYFLGENLDADPTMKVLQRYKYFNNTQNNSPENNGTLNYTPSAYNDPDNEDLNTDNTVSDINAYYSYKINIDPSQMQIGQNYIVDKIVPAGQNSPWYLFRIPIKDLNHPNFIGNTGNITDFKSMRFMRMSMSGFEKPVVLRFVQFQMVASNWRIYPRSLTETGLSDIDEDNSSFTVATVNVEENSSNAEGSKIPYTMPPGVWRDRDIASNVNRVFNEQALSLCVENLNDGQSKGVFKNFSRIDFMNYKRLRLWVHAHSNDPNTLDNQTSAFIRIGTDFTENYYEVEVRLKLTRLGVVASDADQIWPSDNEINLSLADLYTAKIERNRLGLNPMVASIPLEVGNLIIRVKGNPDLNSAMSMMLGVRNPLSDKRAKSVCVWFNELRVTDFIKNDGWATTGRLNIKMADLANITASGRYTTIGFGSIEQKISERNRQNMLAYNLTGQVTLDKFFPTKWGLRLPMYVSYDHQSANPQYDPLNPDILLENSLQAYGQERGREYKRMVIDKTVRRSINFTNVQKVKTGEGKSHLWDIENLSFTYAYTEMLRTNINTASYLSLQRRYGVGYNFSGAGLPIEPFKNAKFLKSPWLALIKDLNVNLLPSNIAVRAELDRNYTRTQLRSADIFGPLNIRPTWEKAFTFNRNYGLGWALTKSLNLNYSADVRAIIDEPRGDIITQEQKDTIWRNLQKFGRMKSFNQNIQANYRLPLDKLPLTDFLSVDLTYNAGINWLAAPLGLEESLGNNLQNNRDYTLNGRIDLTRLYNKSKFLKKVNNMQPKPPKPKKKSDSEKKRGGFGTIPKAKMPVLPADTVKKPREWRFLKQSVRVLMMARNINLNYSITENTALPGYRPNVDLMGANIALNAPGLPFILGDQDPDIRFRAARAGWIGNSPLQNQPFMQARTENISARLTLEPIKDFRIQLDAKRNATAGYQEIFKDTTGNGNFASLSPTRTGSYSVSFVAINTAFSKNDANYRSSALKQMEDNRSDIQSRIYNRDGIGSGDSAYPINSQQVIIPAFRSAYGDENPNKTSLSAFPLIPLPNWRIDYGGLSRIPALATVFSSINLTHSYVSSYTVSNYTSSLEYGADFIAPVSQLESQRSPNTRNQRGNIVPVYNITQVLITEKFAPLVGINVRLKNKLTLKFDYNRDRNMSLNVSNHQITELNSKDFTVGAGYQRSGVRLPLRSKGRRIVLVNELTFRFDFIMRETVQIQRKLDQTNTVTQGMKDYQIRPNINYIVNQRLNVQLYFERTINEPKISNSFRTARTLFGLQLRFSLS